MKEKTCTTTRQWVSRLKGSVSESPPRRGSVTLVRPHFSRIVVVGYRDPLKSGNCTKWESQGWGRPT